MRSCALAALLCALLGACAVRDRPYRFASPMLGTAEVPLAPLPGAPTPPRPELAHRAVNRRATAIRVASAPNIREASAAAAAQVAEAPVAHGDIRAALPGPHRLPAEVPIPNVRELPELRALVGRRDRRDPVAAALAWARSLGIAVEGTTGAELVAWAETTNRLAAPTEPAIPGDLLVFDHVGSDREADLVAVVLGHDERGVSEILYLGGGVIRRGFIDATRPTVKRDLDGRIVNTFIRHGRRWPAKGSHYLTGELVAHLIRAR
jgi:hypothetical protein